MKKLLLTEQCFVVFALMNFTQGWLPILYEVNTGGGISSATSDGVFALQLPFYFIYAVTLCLIFFRWKRFINAATKSKLLLLFVAIAQASVLWSDEPFVTLRRSSAALGTTLFGLYFATRFNLKEQLHLLAWAFGLAAVSSLIFALAFPAYGINAAQGSAWRGVFLHKNPHGMMMTISAMVFLLIAMSSRKYRNLMWAGFGLSVSLVVLSTAKTPLILLLTILALLPLYRALRWNPSWTLLFFIVAVILLGSFAILLLSNWETVLTSMGKDVTLTGRTEVWAAVLDMLHKRPWLGYGYSGFWLGDRGGSADVRRIVGWPVTYAHNGILDLLLDLGYLGALVFVLNFLISCFSAIAAVRWSKTANSYWPLLLLTYTLLSNLTDSTILKPNNIIWVLYVAASLSTSLCSPKDIDL